jgi:hypothetical protein
MNRIGRTVYDHLPVMSSEDNSTGTCLLALPDLVDFIEAFSLVGCFQLLGKIIVADCAGINHRFRRKEILIVMIMEITTSDKSSLTAAPRAVFWAAPPAT